MRLHLLARLWPLLAAVLCATAHSTTLYRFDLEQLTTNAELVFLGS